MDQRNAGKSVGDVKPDHGWHTFAGDHFALMDHLGFDKFHVMGGCIGGSYCFEAIEHDPERVAAAVVQNPIGLWENRDTWDAAIKGYSETVRSRDPSISEETIQSFGRNMFGSDFVFSVTRDFVRDCRTPLFLQPGTDKPHPAKTSEEIAALYKRGEQLIQQGDIAAARLMFTRAASVGDARSALALGASYDPDVLRKLGVVGVAADAVLAREWYSKASSFGSREAAQRIELMARGR